MRIVFLGTGEIAIPSFRLLLEKHCEVVALVTQPDRPVGRHQVLTSSPLKMYAEEYDVPVLQPESLRTPEAIAQIAALKPDLMVVMAYGQILSQALLDVAPLGCVNLHASLLPRHRGASCIQAALDAGDKKTGVTLMYMVPKLDAGDVIAQMKLPLNGKETGQDVHDALAEEAAALLCDYLPLLLDGTAARVPQDEALMTYAPKLMRADGKLDWAWSAEALERRIRAYHTWPGTYTHFIDSKGQVKSLKILPPVQVVERSGEAGAVLGLEGDTLLVACGQKALALTCVQPEGGKVMDVAAFVRGQSAVIGSLWGA